MKKGFAGDFAFYLIFIFAISIAAVVIYGSFSTFNDAWQNSTNVPDASKNIVSDTKVRFQNTWNWLILLLFVGLFIGIVVLAYVIRSHPIFAVFGILVIIVLGVVAVYLANSYNSFATSSGISVWATDLNIITLLNQRMPLIAVVFGFVFIIVLYAKNTNPGVGI